jgi:hypothetical protein
MKKSNYLVVGTAERGLSKPILKILSEVAKYTKAKVVYSGALSTGDELAMYNRRAGRIKAFQDTNIKPDRIWADERENQALIGSRNKRIQDITDGFEKASHKSIIWVTNDELVITDDLPIKYVTHFDVSPYLTITPVAPNGNKVSGAPITPRAVNMYRYFNNSVIAPHPIFQTQLFDKEGVNRAMQFITTGALRWPKHARRPSESYEHATHPGAILLTVDHDTGLFYHQRIVVDRATNGQLFVVWDGLLFTVSGVAETESQDRAVMWGDTHAPFEAHHVLQSVYQCQDMMKASTGIHLGDLVDFQSVNRHAEPHSIAHENLRLADDLASLEEHISLISTKFEYGVVLESNHHEWLTQYVDNQKKLIGLLDWPSIVKKLVARYPNVWVRYQKSGLRSYDFGDIDIRHGHNDGSIGRIANEYNKVVNGHFHSHQEYMNAIRLGCTCEYDLPYKPDAKSKWMHQFATVTKYRGISRLHAKTVLQHSGKTYFTYRGDIYETAK